MPRTKPVCVHIWNNGMGVATRVFKRSKNDEPSDVIELTIRPANGRGKQTCFYCNVVDAISISHALLAAASTAIIQGSPIEPAA